MLDIQVDKKERAIVVGVVRPDQDRHMVNEYLDELEFLAETAGAEVVERLVQERQKLDPAYLLGRGKAEELAGMSKYLDADLILFDDDLTLPQIRNLERMCDKKKIIDRSGLILDIFAKHARTREARTQVELAQLQYMLPRLTRQWSHLSRQAGGIGLRGPGETQLEVDRRLVRKRIAHLQKDLERIARQRDNRRGQRDMVFKAALVGYTNVGKSTIMNALTNAEVLVENRLFATLDSTVRSVEVSDHHNVLLIDTVGFIRKLPHHLVASFESTLEEAVEADLLLHVVDVSSPAFRDQMRAVESVLKDLDISKKPTLLVFNKIDLVKDRALLDELKATFPNSVFVAAARGVFLQDLVKKIIEYVEKASRTLRLSVPLHRSKEISKLHELADILNIDYQDNHAVIDLRTNPVNAERIERMLAHS